MANSLAALAQHVRTCVGSRLSSIDEDTDPLTIEVAAADLAAVCVSLRDDQNCRFEQLSDLCGLDYLRFREMDWETESATLGGFSRGRSSTTRQPVNDKEKRFAVVYHLLSITHNHRLRLRTYPQGEPPRVASMIDVWASANWFEREAFDLFGILFEGHPDLRRLLTDYGFIGHPFRKDFPLEGNVEVRYDPEKHRVVYQPVTIENRVLVPRVIRNDGRFGDSEQGDAEDTTGA